MIKVAAVDIGASTGRVLEYTYDGDKFSAIERARFENKLEKRDGHYYWDVEYLFDEIKKGLKACDKDIACVGVDTWGVDYVLIGKDGSPVYPAYSYRDHRHDNALEKVFSIMPSEEVYERTGIQFMSINTLFQLYEHNIQEGEHIEATEKILYIPDYFNYCLSGKMKNEYTIASTSQMLSASERIYDKELLKAISLDSDKLADIIYPGEIIGKMEEGLAKECDLTNVKIAAVGCHDTASAVAASPVVDEDTIYLSSGTWSLMGVEAAEPSCTKKAYDYNFTNEGGVFGTIRLLKNITGMWIGQQIKKDLDSSITYDMLVNDARSSEQFKFLIDPNDPRFANPENMLEELKSFVRETGQGELTNVGEAFRCIYESLAFSYKQVKLALEDVTGRKYSKINIVGGGCKNAMLNQMCADFCGIEVTAGPIEATALGNAAVQMIALGEIKDITQAREIIKKSEDLKIFTPSDVDIDEIYKRFISYQQRDLS